MKVLIPLSSPAYSRRCEKISDATQGEERATSSIKGILNTMPLQQFLFDIIVIQTETAMDCVLIKRQRAFVD